MKEMTMYNELNNMGATETAIEYAVLNLSKRGKPFKFEDIANFCNCSTRAIARHVPKMLRAKVILREGSRRNGFIYKLGENAKSYEYLPRNDNRPE